MVYLRVGMGLMLFGALAAVLLALVGDWLGLPVTGALVFSVGMIFVVGAFPCLLFYLVSVYRDKI
jgi:hypothetical protein